MTFATLTSKGQTTFPLEVRTASKLKTGDRVHFTVVADDTVILRVKNRSVRDRAIRPRMRKRVSVEEMTL